MVWSLLCFLIIQFKTYIFIQDIEKTKEGFFIHKRGRVEKAFSSNK